MAIPPDVGFHMAIPPEVAWLVPVVIPFVVGILLGAIVKRTVKLAFAVAALVIILVGTGIISLTLTDVFDKAMELLPRLIETGEGVLDALPYSSGAFLVGLGIGLWRG